MSPSGEGHAVHCVGVCEGVGVVYVYTVLTTVVHSSSECSLVGGELGVYMHR